MKQKFSCFKAYDIRGKVPEELNENLAYMIGQGYSQVFKPSKIIVGFDARLECPKLTNALMLGLTDEGVDVINIGLCGTEEVYFHTFDQEKNGVDGGIMVTASHNPKGYNGMKLVQKGSRPISGESGLNDIHDYICANADEKILAHQKGSVVEQFGKENYIQHLLSYVDISSLRPLKIVVNPGNGTAGLTIKQLEKFLPFNFIYLNENIDGDFPKGVPNPLLPENREETSRMVKEHNADFGIAWDGDFDRCFLFDQNGDFIEGYYIVGLLAEAFLSKNPGEKIIHDPRLTWNTIDCVREAGGIAVQSKTGHAFIKERMRLENAIYGGEMSAHHYFRDFAYCDSGMIPWLLIAELMSKNNISLSAMVEKRMEKYPCSGEINYKVSDSKKILLEIESYYSETCLQMDKTDGLSMAFSNWRFNVRSSNTEPLLRLNVEAKSDNNLVLEKVKLLENIIKK